MMETTAPTGSHHHGGGRDTPGPEMLLECQISNLMQRHPPRKQPFGGSDDPDAPTRVLSA
jgi:hypothetical protein